MARSVALSRGSYPGTDLKSSGTRNGAFSFSKASSAKLGARNSSRATGPRPNAFVSVSVSSSSSSPSSSRASFFVSLPYDRATNLALFAKKACSTYLPPPSNASSAKTRNAWSTGASIGNRASPCVQFGNRLNHRSQVLSNGGITSVRFRASANASPSRTRFTWYVINSMWA